MIHKKCLKMFSLLIGVGQWAHSIVLYMSTSPYVVSGEQWMSEWFGTQRRCGSVWKCNCLSWWRTERAARTQGRRVQTQTAEAGEDGSIRTYTTTAAAARHTWRSMNRLQTFRNWKVLTKRKNKATTDDKNNEPTREQMFCTGIYVLVYIPKPTTCLLETHPYQGSQRTFPSSWNNYAQHY